MNKITLTKAEEVERGRLYLLRISGEWFVGSFTEEEGWLNHSCSGQHTMWDNYSLGELQDKGLLEAAYPLPD